MKNWKEWKSDNDDEIIVTVDKKETSSGSTFDNALRFVNQFDNTLEILRHYESQGYEVAESNIDYYLFKKVKKDAGEPTVADIPVGTGVGKILCMCNPSRTVEIEEALKAKFPCLSIMRS